MSSSATGVGMPICFLGAILLILTQKSSQKFGDVLGIFYFYLFYIESAVGSEYLCFICSLFRCLRHRYYLRMKSASLSGWGMTARLCISRLLYMGGNVSYLLRMFSFFSERTFD